MKPARALSLLFLSACATTPQTQHTCAASSPEPLAPLSDLGGILFEAQHIYWTEQTGAVKRLTKDTLQTEMLAQINAAPQQLCRQDGALLWYQRSTSYDEPNQLIRFDLATRQRQQLAIDYLAPTPELICQPDKLYFINRGRKLIEAGPEGLRELLRTSGAPLQLQSDGRYLYDLQREFQGLKYSHNSLLQLDPLTQTSRTLLGPPLSPIAFAIYRDTLYASVYHSEAGHYALLAHTPQQTIELLRSDAPLSTLAADEGYLYFTQQAPNSYTIYRLDLKQQQLVPWLEGLAYAPTHLSLDADFLYWVGVHPDSAPGGERWLMRARLPLATY